MVTYGSETHVYQLSLSCDRPSHAGWTSTSVYMLGITIQNPTEVTRSYVSSLKKKVYLLNKLSDVIDYFGTVVVYVTTEILFI